MPPKLLLITDRDLGILSKGNVIRIRNLVKAFGLMDYEIAMICGGLSIHDELRHLCSEVITVGESFEGGAIRDFSPEKYIAATVRISGSFRPRLVIATYAWMAVCLDYIQTPCIKAVDTHDILFEHARQRISAGLLPWVTCSAVEEKELLNKADIIIAIQEKEQQILGELLPGKRVVCIPHMGEVQSRPDDNSHSEPVIGFAGSAHAGNLGILDFIRDCWPLVRQDEPVSRLLVIGTAGDWIKEKENIQVMPYVSDMGTFYDAVTVIICPVLTGTGLKIKFVEALLYGKAIVATAIAAGGAPPAGEVAYLLAHDWTEFSQKILKLVHDNSLRKRIESGASAYAAKYFSYEAGIKKIRELELGAN